MANNSLLVYSLKKNLEKLNEKFWKNKFKINKKKKYNLTLDPSLIKMYVSRLWGTQCLSTFNGEVGNLNQKY